MFASSETFKALVTGSLLLSGMALLPAGAALASDLDARGAALNAVQAHELSDIDTGIQILELIDDLAQAKDNEIQNLILSMQDDINSFELASMTQMQAGNAQNDLSELALDVTLSFKAFDAAQYQLEYLELEAANYEYALEILAFFAD
ncbi:MAG: hypothetical protein ACO3NE_10795 [Alphaproteobacteria bacterium]|jgi:hypothetical protein